MQAEGDDPMSTAFVTLDPILDVNPLEFADWCATEPTEPSTAPVDIDARWSHHVRESTLDPSNLLFVLLIDQDENGHIRPPLDEKRISSCLLYTSPSPRDLSTSRMPSSA